MSTSNYLENALINAVLRNTAYTSPATVYVALHTADPTDVGNVGEVSTSGTGYARTAVTFGAPTDGVATNSAAVTFPTATASWGTVSYFSIWDASSAGNCLFVSNAMTTPKAINTGDTAQFAVGQLSVTLT